MNLNNVNSFEYFEFLNQKIAKLQTKNPATVTSPILTPWNVNPEKDLPEKEKNNNKTNSETLIESINFFLVSFIG